MSHKLIKPRLKQNKTLKWNPEPFIAQITNKGIIEHFEPQNPQSKIYLAAAIPQHIFDAHAKYYSSHDHARIWLGWMFKWLSSANPIYLIAEYNKSDCDDDIYCISFPIGILTIFGKLTKTSTIYKRCGRAFSKIIND